MRANPDEEYQWIGHMMDHSGQFHVLWAQKHKTGQYFLVNTTNYQKINILTYF